MKVDVRIRKRRFSAAVFLLVLGAAGRGWTLDNGAVQRILFSVTSEKDVDGRSWIAMRGEYAAVLDAAPEEIMNVLCAYEALPSVFNHTKNVRVLDNRGDIARIQQTMMFAALGITFASTSELFIRNERSRPDGAAQYITMIKGDGSMLKSEASWTMESLAPAPSPAKKPRCRIVYRLESWSGPRYPLQEIVMRDFGSKDIEDVVRQLAEAVQRNRAAVMTTASVSPTPR